MSHLLQITMKNRRSRLVVQAAVLSLGVAIGLGVAKAETTGWWDVQPGQWYSEAVEYSSRWLQGHEGGAFGVVEPVTRSQLATVLMRYDFDQGLESESFMRALNQQGQFIRDLAAVICLNRESFLDSVELNAAVPSELNDPRTRYAEAIERLCLSDWQKRTSNNDPYNFQRCHDTVDVEHGTIGVRFCAVQE